ncbi:hypothetical protein SLG_05210 [Sphingobium sp. SYK-6]|uniref:hypothetical protein n=1 Tax=Sphingobium sp. (strain NBRC 103272 / SYK-6) TaxID=627192 RepID=UPI00022766DC|nr:hypothetical protein [Sphingobium sp. SYK-6]BAK65196.1 hypothetical protein SLG_05210 [Sphingobium sp. SYK-6]
MNRFEQAVYDCMKPTEALYEQTRNPFHRKIILNFWRHVHLEGAGLYDQICADDMMVERPVYRITWGANPAVIEGREGVKAFYDSVGDVVLWNSDDRIAVADWGIADELTFNLLGLGGIMQAIGYDVPDPHKFYHVRSRQAFIWPYDSRALLAGEHLYEDKTSLVWEEVDEAELTTAARVKAIQKDLLDQLHARFGEKFWVWEPDAATV